MMSSLICVWGSFIRPGGRSSRHHIRFRRVATQQAAQPGVTTYDQGRFHRIGSRDRSLQPKGPVAVVPRCVGEPLGEDPFEVSAIGDEDPIKVTNSRCQGASSENPRHRLTSAAAG